MVKRILVCVMSFCMVLWSAFVEAAPNETLIASLPGYDGCFPSLHYSGYVNVDEKRLYYYFVVSERSPESDPVVLWLNGGPGCSSFDGFVYEHGPFNFKAGNPNGSLPTLQLNPYSWSKVSNIIYLDSPAGVGYSYSKNKSDYMTGDRETSNATHQFLLNWFNLYPEFGSNSFYIAGESFAGIYVPTLADAVVKGIQSGVTPKINFKGYMLGNAVCDDGFDDAALVPFAHGMGLISDELFMDAQKVCGQNFSTDNSACNDEIDKVQRATDGLNIYDILEPCYHQPTETSTKGNSSLPLSFQQLGVTNRPLPVRTRMFGRAWPFRAPVKPGIVPSWPELASKAKHHVMCTSDEVATAWLNDPQVRKAIHAEPEEVADQWELCTRRVYYSHETGSMIPYHRNLTRGGYPALIYSGDHDMCVPFTGTHTWIKSLGYKKEVEWKPWFVGEQVAGYMEKYANNLTFLTIKGAGHTVPEYKPQESLEFYSRWLEGKLQ